MTTVGVVGTGVIGACVAFNLARRGVHVHCLDRAEPGGLTTSVSFARLSAFQQPTYTRFELSHTGILEYDRFAAQFDHAPWRHHTGSVAWSDDDGRPAFDADVDRLASWGYQVVHTDAGNVNRDWEPGIAFAEPGAPAVLFPDEGWIDGPLLVASLLEKASEFLTFWNSAVEDVEVRGDRVAAVRLATGDRIEVDAVVNAAGPEASTVAAMLGAPMVGGISTRSSLVLDLTTDGDPLRRILRGADVHARSAGSGRVRVRSEQVDACLPKVNASEAGDELVMDLLDRAHRTIPALTSSIVDIARVGTATFPTDGLPSVGALSAIDGYYEAFANSGITLAPFIGRTLATQIVTGEVHPLWAPCSPDRLRASNR